MISARPVATGAWTEGDNKQQESGNKLLVRPTDLI